MHLQRHNRMLRGLLAAAVTFLLAARALAGDPAPATSDHLKKWLEKFPDADANHDGILTPAEIWEHLATAPQRRAEQLKKSPAAPKGKMSPKAAAPALPPPGHANVRYGPHERNVLDFWPAKTGRPAPLLVYIHGGGWTGGDKNTLAPVVLAECLEAGMAVAAINYRFTTTAMLPAPHRDSARAIQFLRAKAAEWNFDPKRVATYGGSAGAGLTLWLAFHDDMADPASADPIARQSTRLSCGATIGGQSTYDPGVITEWIGESAARHAVFHPAYGVKSFEELADPKLQPLYDEVSAIKHLTADDPPIFQIYTEPNAPLTPNARIGQGMHHPIFGLKLKAAMDRLKIECVYFHTIENQANSNTEMVKFFRKQFGLP